MKNSKKKNQKSKIIFLPQEVVRNLTLALEAKICGFDPHLVSQTNFQNALTTFCEFLMGTSHLVRHKFYSVSFKFYFATCS